MDRYCLVLLILITLFSGCRTIKEIPVQTVEKVVVKDSIVHIHDTVEIPLFQRVLVNVIPQVDTSYLSTELAVSTAYLDTLDCTIHHTLEHKKSFKTEIEKEIPVRTIEKVVEKDVPVQVEVIKYRRDALFWVSISFNLLTLLIIALKLWLRKH